MTKRSIYVTISVLLIAIPLAVYGGKEAAGQQGRQEEQRGYSTEPFSKGITTIPTGYRGHDIVAVYQDLAKALPSTDELEQGGSCSKSLKELYSQGLLAFVCGQPTEDQPIKETRASYNADKQIMSVTFLPLTGFSSSLAHSSFIVFKKIKAGGERQIVDGSDDEAVVKTFYEEHYGVVSDDPIHLSEDIEFRLSPQEAGELIDHAGVLLVCRIKPVGNPPEYTLLESSLSFATAASPVETFYFQHLVGVELLEIWIFSKKTGTVYVKKEMKTR